VIRPDYDENEHGIKINMVPGGETAGSGFIHMMAGTESPKEGVPANPSTGVDEFFIHDYWYCPAAFYTEFMGVNPEWNDEYIRGEYGALKRHMIHLMMMGKREIQIKPISLLICLENVQHYYSKMIKKDQEYIKELEGKLEKPKKK
jgi:hypothetical protein